MDYRARYEDGSTKVVNAPDMYHALVLCFVADWDDRPKLIELKRIDESEE
jgi:hypothetical protein